jgi:outer membrane protein OmpA-like peptidoglycan-associated protein
MPIKQYGYIRLRLLIFTMFRLLVVFALMYTTQCAAQCRKGTITESSGATGTGELCKVKIKPTYGAPYYVDVKSGEWSFNNENNVLYSKGSFKKNGAYSTKEGMWTWYSEDGVALVRVLYVNDQAEKLFVLDTGLAICGDDSVKVSTTDNIHYTTQFKVRGVFKEWVAENLIETFEFRSKNKTTTYNAINGVIGVQEELKRKRYEPNRENEIWTDRQIIETHIPEVSRLLSSDTHRFAPDKNLVENPLFLAEKKDIPDGKYALTPSMISGWYPFIESPDLFVTEGKVCMGFRTAGVNYEVVRGELLQPLEKDKTYCFSMRIKLKYDNNYTTNNIGVVIAKPGAPALRRNNAKECGTLILSPENSPPALRDSWMTIRGSFKAAGGENEFYIGQFNTDSKTRYWPLDSVYSGTSGEIYFYFKDPTLAEINSATPCQCTSEQCDTTATENPVDEVLVFQNIKFKTGDWQLLESSFSALDSLFDYLSGKNNFTLEILGHTDNQGDKNQNLVLSEKRAKAVYDYLIKAGVDKKRLKYAGKGDTMPIADNEEEEGRMANRRVEFYIKQP